MKHNERAVAGDCTDANVVRAAGMSECVGAHGTYEVECVGADGQVKWRDTIENVVCTEGKNVMLDAGLAGSSYTAVGPYMGLISNTGWSAVAAADTAAQINGSNGWKEAGGANAPSYTGNRKLAVWSAAASGSKALSSSLAFGISSGSNVILKGVFMIFGTGALSTKDDTNGKLWSAGAFASGDKTVSNGDTLNVSYTTGL